MFRSSIPPAVWLGLLVFSAAGAQDFRAKLQGRISDSSDAVIGGASVTLVNLSTGVTANKPTNEVGLYRFDYLDPGPYRLTVEAPGFSRFIQENIVLQASADITINATLSAGDVKETVTVEASPVAVDFNSAGVKTTIDTKLANDLPRLDRNPFKLTLLNPAVLETRRQEMNPFQSLSANSLDLGGGTSQRNDLLVDGSPISIGVKASYTPNTDAIQEVNVHQNSVDAEAGHSAGGVVSMTLKSGTNDWHGTMFYLGRNPALNAMTDRTTQSSVASRYNIWGGTVGHPVIRNKLFNFASYEQWKQLVPQAVLRTVPTALEKTGDFSQSMNINGGVRTIYDPYSTLLDPVSGKVTRTPFAGNRVPSSRFDPLAVQFMSGLFQPNAVPDNITGTNNFKSSQTQNWSYWNISDRADWYLSEKWRIYGRVSRYHTVQDIIAPLMQASPAYMPHGTARHTFALPFNVIYTMSARTVMDFRAEYHNMIDDWSYPKYQLPAGGWSKYWPNNAWYKAYQVEGLPVINPGIVLGSSAFYGDWNSTMWYTHENGSSYAGKISQQRGSHFLKAGGDFRRTGGGSTTTAISAFTFSPAMTADTFLNPNTKVVGNEFASFLLGALGSDSNMIVAPIGNVNHQLWAGFFQDDWKLSKRVTLNLGLRYEYERPFYDAEHKESRFLDLTQANPEMTKAPPNLPASALRLRTSPLAYNGSWVFTDSSHPGVWNSQKDIFLPRAGLAFRINDLTALRIGYARYSTPTDMLNFSASPSGASTPTILAPPYGAFNAQQTPLPLQQGVPVAQFSNPFPASNPLVAPIGKSAGGYYGLGTNNLTFYNQDFHRVMNDRLNITLSRQLPNQILGEVTYFTNWGHGLPFLYNLNLMDPQIGYTNKTAIDASVANPFYQYLTPSLFPGPLRNQSTVALKTLLVPYPQYGNLFDVESGRGERYHSIQVKVQRPFRNGYNFLLGYNYNNEKDQQFFDEVATFRRQFTWMPSANGRHRVTLAGTYQFPFGKGRMFLSSMSAIPEAILGGWQSVGTWYFKSGDFLRFGPNSNNFNLAGMNATCDPAVSNPAPQKWFNQSCFSVLPAYTPRTNPWQYDDVRGPKYWEIQATVSKTFNITERIKTEFKLSGFNLTNRLNRDLPDMVVTSSTFGQALRQSNFTTGRQMEYGLKILF